jgi:hypothetical protein
VRKQQAVSFRGNLFWAVYTSFAFTDDSHLSTPLINPAVMYAIPACGGFVILAKENDMGIDDDQYDRKSLAVTLADCADRTVGALIERSTKDSIE